MADEKPEESTPENKSSNPEVKEESKPVDDQAKQHFLDGLFGGQNHREPKEELKEELKEEEPKEEKADDSKEKPEPSEQKEPKEEAEEKPKEETQPAVDASKIAEAVESGVKRAVEAVKPKEETKEEVKEDPDADLSARDKKRVGVLAKMESLFPDQYKGISDRYRKSAKAQKDYIAKWKKENPGETFDANDEEHNDFYDKNNVEWDSDDFEEAKEKAIEERVRESLKSEENKRIKQLEKAEEERRLSGQIESARVSAMTQTLTTVDESYGKFFKDGAIDKAAVQKFSEDEPEVAEIVLGSANTADAVAHEIMKLWNGLEEFDTSVSKDGSPNNPIHAFIHSAAIEAEDAILNGDEAGKVRNGKRFATNQELSQMSPEQQAAHWGIGTEEIIAASSASFAADAKEKVKKFEEKMENFAKRRGFKPSETGKTQNKEVENADQHKEEKPNESKGSDPAEPSSVETGNEKHVSSTPGHESKIPSNKEKFVDRLIHGQTAIQSD